MVESEIDQLFGGLYASMSDRFWVNSIESISRANWKIDQLMEASAASLTVPRTLVTSNAKEALDFFDECGGKMIYKLLCSHVRRSTNKGRFSGVYTNVVTREEIIAREKEISVAPCLFQEYVNKQFELRVTIIGKSVFTVSIDSQKSPRSAVDWRRYDTDRTPYSPYQLDSAIERQLLELVKRYGLVFACIDLIVRPDGEVIFLELNPNGQWYWLEPLSGIPLTARFAEFLVDHFQSETK